MQTVAVLALIGLILVIWSRWLAHCNAAAVCLIIAFTGLLSVVAQEYAPGLSGLAYSLLAAVVIVLFVKGN